MISGSASIVSPQNLLLSLGYAGWGSGQLEYEIQQNSWLTIEADPEIIFHTSAHERWHKAAQTIGVDITQIGSGVGHA